jgi:hypothetical protein
MNRRQFLAASAAAGAVPLAHAAAAEPLPQGNRQYLELRRYHLLPGSRKQLVDDYLQHAAIPAFNRLGINPVGAFNVVYGPSEPTLYVLLPHPSLESVVTLRQRLADDPEHQRAGAAFLDVAMSEPAFVRVESQLLRAFEQMPRVEAPARQQGKSRIFELRTYESHSDKAALLKLEMFNKGGEIPIFRRTGLTPVFFGEALVGENLPHLTYMLTFEDMRARDTAWSAFSSDPDWRTLSANPRYADTVSTISDLILRPTGYSQI